MSSDPLDPQDWRAPGTEPAASPRVTAVLERLGATLGELATLSLMPLSDDDVERLVDATTSAASA